MKSRPGGRLVIDGGWEALLTGSPSALGPPRANAVLVGAEHDALVRGDGCEAAGGGAQHGQIVAMKFVARVRTAD